MKILLIDNNDSFTRNLEHLLARTIEGAQIQVRPYAEVLPATGGTLDFSVYQFLIISSGPGRPADYPGYGKVIESGRPVLGVCLGMQIINAYCGGKTDRLAGCFHGRAEVIRFNGHETAVARYHSLYCAEVAPGLKVIAANPAGVPMVVCHTQRPLLGYQFHPESFLTEHPEQFIHYALQFCKKPEL